MMVTAVRGLSDDELDTLLGLHFVTSMVLDDVFTAQLGIVFLLERARREVLA